MDGYMDDSWHGAIFCTNLTPFIGTTIKIKIEK